MDENKEEKKNVKQEKNSSFKTVQNPSSYKAVYEKEKAPKARLGFCKGFLVPFVSGVLRMCSSCRYLFWSTIY